MNAHDSKRFILEGHKKSFELYPGSRWYHMREYGIKSGLLPMRMMPDATKKKVVSGILRSGGTPDNLREKIAEVLSSDSELAREWLTHRLRDCRYRLRYDWTENTGMPAYTMAPEAWAMEKIFMRRQEKLARMMFPRMLRDHFTHEPFMDKNGKIRWRKVSRKNRTPERFRRAWDRMEQSRWLPNADQALINSALRKLHNMRRDAEDEAYERSMEHFRRWLRSLDYIAARWVKQTQNIRGAS